MNTWGAFTDSLFTFAIFCLLLSAHPLVAAARLLTQRLNNLREREAEEQKDFRSISK